MKARSFYEIGGVILDGSYGIDTRRFNRVEREYRKGNVGLAVALATEHIVDHIDPVDNVPYSDLQLWLRDWSDRNRRRIRRTIALIPLPPQVKVPLYVLPEVAEMYSYSVGSYDMRTPEVQTYEESVTWGGSGGMII